MAVRKKKTAYTAATADKYELYLKSVQNVEVEIELLAEIYRELRGREMRSLREDFCGAFAAAAEFVARAPGNTAYALDLDDEVLAWGRKYVIPALARAYKGAEKNLTVWKKNVLEVTKPRVDAVLAMNFSYFIFKRREELLRYFKAVHATLDNDGVFFMDCYGGTDAWKVCRDKKKLDGFTYVWDQAEVNPLNNEVLNHIHFYFPDRTKMLKAFSYDWRLWTPREIRELLAEAGFADSGVYWEEWDYDANVGTGNFYRSEKEENCLAWVAYIAARK